MINRCMETVLPICDFDTYDNNVTTRSLIDSISFRSECKQKLVLFALIDRYKKIVNLQSPIRRTLYILLGLATHWFKCNENDEPWQLIKMFSHTSIYGSSGMVIEALY